MLAALPVSGWRERRHPPLLSVARDSDVGVCLHCGFDVLDPIHWPPRGWRERLLDFFGLLR